MKFGQINVKSSSDLKVFFTTLIVFVLWVREFINEFAKDEFLQ